MATRPSSGLPRTTSGWSPFRCSRRSSPAKSGPPCRPIHPNTARASTAVLRDLDAILLPGITHWQHPSFFAYFPANASGPGILGDLLASGLGVQGMIWATSPAATELETHVLDWLAALLDLPTRFRSDGRGARRDPALRIGCRPGRLAGRDSPGNGRPHGPHRRRHRAAHRVHVEPDPLVGGESVPGGRPRHGRAAHDRRRSGNRGRATRSPASPGRGRPGRGLHTGARRGVDRHHWPRGDRPGGRAGPDRAQLRRVAARRCRLGGSCGGLP